MRHTPHLHVPRPWDGDVLAVDDAARQHLERVLRLSSGAEVTYTDGDGVAGRGTFDHGAIRRGDETMTTRSGTVLTVASAVPKAKERQRFLVEKLAELGVARLRWLTTQRSEGRPPPHRKARAWAVAALEQSRRCFLMEIDGPVSASDAAGDDPCWVAGAGGVPVPTDVTMARLTLLVGPEGGFAPEELVPNWLVVALSDGVLRVETAAVAGAVSLLQPTSLRD